MNDIERCGFERRRAVWGKNVSEAELRTSINRCQCPDCRRAVRAKAFGTRPGDAPLEAQVEARRKIIS